METLKYKDFLGSVEVSVEDNCVYGKILHINDLITYEANSPLELKKEFKFAVDDYLKTCEELGIDPHKPYNGVFNVRIEPELHKNLAHYATQKGKTMNSLVKVAIENLLNDSIQKNEINNHYHFSVMKSSIDDFMPKSETKRKDIIQFDTKIN